MRIIGNRKHRMLECAPRITGGYMVLFFMIIFLSSLPLYGMQQPVDIIDQDYAMLVSHVNEMLVRTSDFASPFELLNLLAHSQDINSIVPCAYLSAREHVQLILKKQRIRMGRDCALQRDRSTENMHTWFKRYFQDEIVPRMKEIIKKERDEKLREQYSSSGV